MKIGQDVIDRIIAHAKKDAPIEACGVLIGSNEQVSRHHPMTNAEGRVDHFTFDAREQLAAYREASREGLDVIGVYHSHPATPARPSSEDVRLARDPSLIHLIVSLMDGHVTVKAFRITEGTVAEEVIETYPKLS